MNIGTLDRPSDPTGHPNSPAYRPAPGRDAEIAARAARYEALLAAVRSLNEASNDCISAGDDYCPVRGYDLEDLIHDLSDADDPAELSRGAQERREEGW